MTSADNFRVVVCSMVIEEFIGDSWIPHIYELLKKKNNYLRFVKNRNTYFHMPCDYNNWLVRYSELQFYGLFRVQKQTFDQLLRTLLQHDRYNFVKKKYRGGHYPTDPAKSLLVFLYYMATQDTLNSIGDRFMLVSSTVMKIVNVILYIIVHVKNDYIFWPKPHELEYIANGFHNYPGVIGAVDGCHVDIKVPNAQHDSYADRYLKHSINLMAVCTAQRLFTYVYIGFPGSAHDSRVFSNSTLVTNIERFGANKYFLDSNQYHLIGDAAFPLRKWLMKPYKQTVNLRRIEKRHNYLLSADRVVIENTFGILKGRWRRLHFINTYNISKAIEIITAGCVLHNFCILNLDLWTGEIQEHHDDEEEYREDNLLEQQLGLEKRNRIALELQN